MQCSRADPAAGLDFASFGSDLEAAKAATLQHTQQSNSGSELRTDVIDGATSVGLLLNGTLLLPWHCVTSVNPYCLCCRTYADAAAMLFLPCMQMMACGVDSDHSTLWTVLSVKQPHF